jgi:hypothetical protein
MFLGKCLGTLVEVKQDWRKHTGIPNVFFTPHPRSVILNTALQMATDRWQSR